MKAKTYIYLELLRFLAAFAVVLNHFYFFGYDGRTAPFGLDEVGSGTFFIDIFIRYGMYAVDFFWILSGFIFFSQYERRIVERTVTGWKFFVLRFSRLYPLHLVTMIAVLIAQAGYQSVQPAGQSLVLKDTEPLDVFLHLFMASSWDQGREFTINGPIWSVSQELVAYAIFFVIAFSLGRRALTALTVIAPILLYFYGMSEEHWTLVACILLFFTGGLVQRITALLSKASPFVRKLTLMVSGVLVVLIGLGLAMRMTTLQGFDGPMRNALYVLLVSLILLAVFAREPGVRTSKVFTELGSMTYSSYLVHFPLVVFAMWGFTAAGIPQPWDLPWLLPVYIVVVFAVAWPTYRYFERPAQDAIRSRLLSKR